MNMIAQEWRIVARESAFRWAVLLLLALAALCLWNGARFVADRTAEAQSEVQRSIDKRVKDEEIIRKEAAGEIPPNPWGPSEPTKASWNATRPPGPLAMLSFGREDIEPLSGNVSLWMTRSDNLFRKFQFASPLALAAGRFDAGFLVVLLLPLFVLALGYNVVAQERESGRLKLAQVQGRNLGSRLLVRLLLRVSPAFLVLGVIVAVAAWLGVPAGRLALWGLAGALYLLVWTGITAIIAALPHRSELVALIAAGSWLALAVLVPAIGGGIARVASPTPSAFQAINGARAAEVEANRRLMENLKSYVSDHPELATGDASKDDWAAKLYVSQLAVEKDIAPALAGQREARERQAELTSLLRFLSPTSAVDEVMTLAAGTGAIRQQAYVDQASGFLAEWRETLSPMIFAQARMTPDRIDALPKFAFHEIDLPAVPLAASLGYLILLAAILLSWGARSIGRSGGT